MNSFKYLAIGLLMVSASAVFASEEVDDLVVAGKSYVATVTDFAKDNAVSNHFHGLATQDGRCYGLAGKAQLAGYLLLAGYGLSKVSDTAKSVWNKLRFNKVSDKIEDTVIEAKENPKSKEGAIVGGTVLYGILAYFGHAPHQYVVNYFATDKG